MEKYVYPLWTVLKRTVVVTPQNEYTITLELNPWGDKEIYVEYTHQEKQLPHTRVYVFDEKEVDWNHICGYPEEFISAYIMNKALPN